MTLSSRHNFIEFLRCLAAGLVVLAHFPYFNLPLLGSIGVDLFFVISGYVMALNFHSTHTTPGRFLFRRLMRIYPAYIAATFIFLLIFHPSFMSLLEPRVLKSLSLVLPNSSGRYSDPLLYVGWTLRFELFFYGAVFFALWSRKELTVLGILFAAFLADQIFGFYYGANFILEFALGWWALSHPLTISEKYRRLFLTAAILFFLMAMTGADMGLEVDGIVGKKDIVAFTNGTQLPRGLAWGVPAFLLFCSIQMFAGSFASFWQWGGRYTYGVYLVHPIAYECLKKWGLISSPVLYSFALVGLISVGAGLSYHLIERPLMRWRRLPGQNPIFSGHQLTL